MPCRPVPLQGRRFAYRYRRRPGAHRRTRLRRHRIRARPRSVRRRRMDLVRRHHRHRHRNRLGGLVFGGCSVDRSGHQARHRRHPDVQPADGRGQRAGGAHVGSVGGRGDRRRADARPGHAQCGRRAGLRRSFRSARRSVAHLRPGQPRWLGRLCAHHVRGAAAHRQPVHPLHGRRHRNRAGFHPARARDVAICQVAHARWRSDAQPAGPQSPAFDG